MPARTYECTAVGSDGYVVICRDSKNVQASEISVTKIENKAEITVVEGQYVKVYAAALKLK